MTTVFAGIAVQSSGFAASSPYMEYMVKMVVSVEPRGSLSKLFVNLPRSGVDDAVVDGEGLCCRAGVGGCSAIDGPSIDD